MFKRMSLTLLILSVFIGCQQGGQQQSQQQQSAHTDVPHEEAPPPKPAMRQTDARVMIESVTAKPGESGSFKINYYGIEPLKAIVVPITYPKGMMIDSVSFAGSVVENISTRPVRIENEAQRALISAIPTTEPLIPAVEGPLATFYFTLAKDAVSGTIDEGFLPPANYLVYIDSASTEAEPVFEPGTVTVEAAP